MHVHYQAIACFKPLTGLRYDAVDHILYIDSKIGDSFKTFLSTNTGFGTVEVQQGKPIINVVYGSLDIESCIVSGNKTDFKYQAN